MTALEEIMEKISKAIDRTIATGELDCKYSFDELMESHVPNEENRPIEADQPKIETNEGFPDNYFKIFGFERVKELQEEE